MSETEFWDSTPRYLSARQKAATNAMQMSWEQTRYISYVVLIGAGAKKIKKPQDVCKFPWEQHIKQFPTQTREQLEAFDREADEILRITQPEVYKKFMEAKLNAQNVSTTT